MGHWVTREESFIDSVSAVGDIRNANVLVRDGAQILRSDDHSLNAWYCRIGTETTTKFPTRLEWNSRWVGKLHQTAAKKHVKFTTTWDGVFGLFNASPFFVVVVVTVENCYEVLTPALAFSW